MAKQLVQILLILLAFTLTCHAYYYENFPADFTVDYEPPTFYREISGTSVSDDGHKWKSPIAEHWLDISLPPSRNKLSTKGVPRKKSQKPRCNCPSAPPCKQSRPLPYYTLLSNHRIPRTTTPPPYSQMTYPVHRPHYSYNVANQKAAMIPTFIISSEDDVPLNLAMKTKSSKVHLTSTHESPMPPETGYYQEQLKPVIHNVRDLIVAQKDNVHQQQQSERDRPQMAVDEPELPQTRHQEISRVPESRYRPETNRDPPPSPPRPSVTSDQDGSLSELRNPSSQSQKEPETRYYPIGGHSTVMGIPQMKQPDPQIRTEPQYLMPNVFSEQLRHPEADSPFQRFQESKQTESKPAMFTFSGTTPVPAIEQANFESTRLGVRTTPTSVIPEAPKRSKIPETTTTPVVLPSQKSTHFEPSRLRPFQFTYYEPQHSQPKPAQFLTPPPFHPPIQNRNQHDSTKNALLPLPFHPTEPSIKAQPTASNYMYFYP